MKNAGLENKRDLLINVLLSALIGLLIGVLIFAFKSGAEFLYESIDGILTFTKNQPIYLPVLILGVIFLSCLSYFLLKKEPFARGGGIPVSEGLVRGKIDFNPYRVGGKALLSSYVSYFSSLPLGSEGPSVLLGGCVGKAFNSFIKDKTDNTLIKAGSACAFSAITGAPISGLFFIEEEMHDGVKIRKSLCVFIAILFSCLSNVLLCLAFNKTFAMFGYELIEKIPFKFYFLAIICGVFAGVFSYLFTKLFTLCHKTSLTKLKNVPLFVKLLVCFLTCALISVFISETRGSGHHLIESIEKGGLNYKVLLTVLVLKILMLCLCGSSGATGGMFIPLLALGSLIGGLLGEVFIAFGVPEIVYSGIVISVTVAFLSGAQQSPLTALFFSIEAMGAIFNAPFILIAVLIAFLIVKLFKDKPIYDLLFENISIKASKNN